MNAKTLIAITATGLAAVTAITSSAEARGLRFGIGLGLPLLYRTPDAHYNRYGGYDAESFRAHQMYKRRAAARAAAAAAAREEAEEQAAKKRKALAAKKKIAPAVTNESGPADSTKAGLATDTAPVQTNIGTVPTVTQAAVAGPPSTIKSATAATTSTDERPAKKLDCKQFIATASMTVSVPCPD